MKTGGSSEVDIRSHGIRIPTHHLQHATEKMDYDGDATYQKVVGEFGGDLAQLLLDLIEALLLLSLQTHTCCIRPIYESQMP